VTLAGAEELTPLLAAKSSCGDEEEKENRDPVAYSLGLVV